MQILDLLQFGLSGPLDNDAFTFDATSWLATQPGDSLLSATVSVYYQGGGAQSDITQTSFYLQSPVVTVWLTGGVPGNTYQITVHLVTAFARSAYKSALLTVVSARS